jgi:cell division control protein 6
VLVADRLEQLFDSFVGGSSVFLDREVLRHDYIPEELPHREAEILRFGAVLGPSLKGIRCSNLFIYGKSGTGKTAVAKYVLDRIAGKSKTASKKVRVCYVNCRKAGTEYRTLSAMCSAVGVKVPFTGLATAEVLSRFKLGLEDTHSMFIVALDEIDTLVRGYGDGIMYKLTRINEELKYSRLTVIGISNDLYFKDLLDARVRSSLSEEEMVFKPYTAEQIRDILSHRVRLAFHPEKLPSTSLNLVAALAAAEHGDARRALDLLRVSGELAERFNASAVHESHIREAQKKIEHDRVIEVLDTLPLHSKILLCALYLRGEESKRGITTGDLYDTYHGCCGKLSVDPLTQRRVSGLLSELDMLGIVSAKIANLGRYGRTKRIQVNAPRQTLSKVFAEDTRLNEVAASPHL